MYQNPVNRLYPFNFTIKFLEIYFKETETGKILNVILFIIVDHKEQPNSKNKSIG